MVLQVMELGEPDLSGRRSPTSVEGQTHTVEVDEVIVSVGVSPNPLISQSMPELETTKWGTLVVNQETMQSSSMPVIFAGGDIVRGGATVILAMGDGRRAAKAMDEWILGQSEL
jgi:glutamate synthase (NADPH/NADH) small chain